MVSSGEESCSCSFIAFAVEFLRPCEEIPGLFLILMAANVMEGESVVLKEFVGNCYEFKAKVNITFYTDGGVKVGVGEPGT